jgi:SAM-dependent methyltransferase
MVIRTLVPKRLRRPYPRIVRWGSFSRTEPISKTFGLDRGTPIDRIYIEDFLSKHAPLITGAVLEIGGRFYMKKFGVGVSKADVLHATADNPEATIVGSLEDKGVVLSVTYDCIILTQVLQFIRNPFLALTNCHDALKPGGSVLITVAGISQISRYDADRWGDYWRFTPQGLEFLLKSSSFRELNLTAYSSLVLLSDHAVFNSVNFKAVIMA